MKTWTGTVLAFGCLFQQQPSQLHMAYAIENGIEPNLPFGDINVLVLTDVHTWVGSHSRQEPHFNADYGDVLSFYDHLKRHCNHNDMDLWFVSNGDFVHGTGLSREADISSLVPILQKMPWDAVSCGNHELYEDPVVEYMTRPGGYVDWWGDAYLTANVRLIGPDGQEKPLGRRYKVLHGQNSKLLVFGFLYNLGYPSSMVHVEKVENVVKEQWFHEALTDEEYDAIMILAHMDLVDPLVSVIREAIRDVVGETIPIQFITGHTHYRGVKDLDPLSTTFEAGRYLDTVGFVSFPTAESAAMVGSANATELFKSSFLDANRQILAETLGVDNLHTGKGKELSDFIGKTKTKMGLEDEIGCAPQDYYYDVNIDDESSLWGLYRDVVAPSVFFKRENEDDISCIMFLSKESWRYNLLSTSNLVVDDIWAVAPFNDVVTYMGTFTGGEILRLNETMNENRMKWLGSLPNYILIGVISAPSKKYKLYTHDFNAESVKKELDEIVPGNDFEPKSTQYTSTKIWLSFVSENWPCNGVLGELPDWFPTPEHVKNLSEEDNEVKEGMAASATLILLFLCLILGCCWCAVRSFCCNKHRLLVQNELEAFKVVDGGDDEDNDFCATDGIMVTNHDDQDDDKLNTSDATTEIGLSDEDHEML